jgi:hypothetical protein
MLQKEESFYAPYAAERGVSENPMLQKEESF